MRIDIDDFLCTLRSLEAVSSPKEIYTLCAATLPKTRLYPVGTIRCGIVKTLMAPLSLFGLTQKKCIDSVVERTKKVFEDFSQYLKNPESTPSSLTKYICVLTHFPEWRGRLVHAHTLLMPHHRLPLAIAERIFSPCILESVTGTTIPWELLENIFRSKKIDVSEEIELGSWASELQRHAAKISTKLFLGVFRQLSYRLDPHKTEKKRTDDAFDFAQILSQKFGVLFAWDSVFKRKVIGKILEKVQAERKKIIIGLSYGSQVSAYFLKEQPSRSVLISTQPMLLGMLENYLLRSKENSYPLLTVHERDDDGEYLIVDRIVGTLDSISWGSKPGITDANRPLVDSLSRIVKAAFTIKGTHDFVLNKFLVTHESKICLLEQLSQKHENYFSICEIEQFVQKACRGDAERMAHVMKASGFFSSPYAAVFSKVLALAEDIDLEIPLVTIKAKTHSLGKPEDPSLPDLPKEITQWLSAVSIELHHAAKELKQEVPIRTFVDSVIVLQQKLGFLSIVPKRLHVEIVHHIRERAACRRARVPRENLHSRPHDEAIVDSPSAKPISKERLFTRITTKVGKRAKIGFDRLLA